MLTPEQIEARKDTVGGSDAPVVVGLSKRMTARRLYHEKRGELDSDNFEPELAWLGHEIEPLSAKAYTRQTGRRTVRCNATLNHPDLHWMSANIDRKVPGRNPKRGLELKMRVHATEWGPAGTDQVPDDVLIQCSHYLGVTGFDVWDVLAFIGGREFRHYEIPRDQTLIDRLIFQEQQFIDAVRSGVPPAVDLEHPTARALLQKLYPGTDGRTVGLGESFAHWHAVRIEAQQKIKQYEAAFNAATAHIESEIGMASMGIFPNGDAYTRKRVVRAGHEVKRSEYIQTRFQRGATEKL